MIKKAFRMVDIMGLHARPASLLTKKASTYETEIKIQYKTKEVNLKSIMAVMSLGVSEGDVFTILVEGNNEEVIMDDLTQVLIDNNLVNES